MRASPVSLINLQRRRGGRPRLRRRPTGRPIRPVSAQPWFVRYAASVVLVGLIALVHLVFRAELVGAQFIIYVPAIALSGMYGGFGPGLLTTVLSLAASLAITGAVMSLTPLPLTISFVVVGAVISFINHLLHEALRALRMGEERFQLLVQGVREYAIMLLDPEGNVVSWNEGARRITGYSEQDAVGKSVAVFFSDEERAERKPEQLLDAVRKTGYLENTGWRVRRDGSRFWADSSITAVHDERGSLLGFAKITRDMTGRRLREQALREAVADLESFSYTVSHDLRAPLRALQGYASIVLKKAQPRLDAESSELLRRVAASAARMDRLIQDLLVYGRLSREDYQMYELELEPIVDHVVGQYQSFSKADVSVERPLGRARGQDSLLVQIVSHLLDNAIKFVPSERRASVLIRVERRSPESVRLVVEDNGVGIPAAYLSKVFEPFVRLEPSESDKGTGIGLAIVKRAAERMGGAAGAESEVGKGSRFWVDLPSC